jgi:hypothetical protein
MRNCRDILSLHVSFFLYFLNFSFVFIFIFGSILRAMRVRSQDFVLFSIFVFTPCYIYTVFKLINMKH